jgi:hypothetical protein
MENNIDPYFYEKIREIFYNKWYKYIYQNYYNNL